jgi:ParB/RepB/Spo0J family partition protein
MNDDPAAPVGAQIKTGWNAVTVPIPVDLVDPNPHQPRLEFDPAKLEELAASIKTHGLIQPIVVQPNDDRFTLHDGERRLRAAKLAGLTEIPAYIIPHGMDARQLLLRAIVANDQRADLSAIERANGYQKLADDHGLSDSDIAKQVSKSRSAVANTRRLLQLPPGRQAQVVAGELSERAALALLPFYQLPAEAQKKILDSWDGKKLAKPNTLTSDQIRNAISAGVRRYSEEITLVKMDQAYTGKDIHHPTCTGCDMHVQPGNVSRCLKASCLKAKQNQSRTVYLEEAKAATGVDYLDPSGKYNYEDIGGFYSPTGLAAVRTALDNHCPNLRLQIKPNQWTSGPGPAAFDQCLYACLHNNKGCACKKASEAEKDAAEKAKKQAVKQLADQAANHLTRLIKDNPTQLFRAILYSMGSSWDGNTQKVLQLKPDKLITKLAERLIDHGARPNEYRSIEDNQKALNDWLTLVGLPAMATDQLADLDRRLVRIEGWLTDHPEQPPAEQIKAIRGNLTNLAHIAEELAQLDAPELTARFDTAKRTLLIWLDQVEKQAGYADEIAGVKFSLSTIADWLANPENHTAQKLLNRGQTVADLAYVVNTLINQHGPQPELTHLLTEIETVEALCMGLRRNLNDNGTSEPLPLEAIQ